jgi:hypothetical protein
MPQEIKKDEALYPQKWYEFLAYVLVTYEQRIIHDLSEFTIFGYKLLLVASEVFQIDPQVL